MPLTYLDSSALVKRYVPEVGSRWVAWLCRHEPIAVSLIAIPEIASALARRTREGALTAEQRDLLWQAFLHDARSVTLVGLDSTTVQQTATFLLTAPPHVRLRTLDAIHVASARRLFGRARENGIATGSFVTANPEDYP